MLKTGPGTTGAMRSTPKLETQLKWSTRTSFDVGLQETIEWYRCNTEWIDHVRSGAYRTYYDRMYEHRGQTLSER